VLAALPSTGSTEETQPDASESRQTTESNAAPRGSRDPAYASFRCRSAPEPCSAFPHCKNRTSPDARIAGPLFHPRGSLSASCPRPAAQIARGTRLDGYASIGAKPCSPNPCGGMLFHSAARTCAFSLTTVRYWAC
jgi:hypothetical protein